MYRETSGLFVSKAHQRCVSKVKHVRSICMFTYVKTYICILRLFLSTIKVCLHMYGCLGTGKETQTDRF